MTKPCPEPPHAHYWTVHVHGPDDLMRFDTENAARRHSAQVNRLADWMRDSSPPNDVPFSAHVIPPEAAA